MSFKSLVVHTNGTDRNPRTLHTAAALAARADAHLTGTFIYEPIFYHYPASYSGELEYALVDDRNNAEKRSDIAKAAFEKACLAADVNNSDWRHATGETMKMLTLYARYADLVLMSQSDEKAADIENADPALAPKLAIASGRPVLAIPKVGKFERLGQRILVAWDASREATRAVREALPLLHDAEQVTVLSVNPKTRDYKGHGEEPGADIALHLARHGIKVNIEHTTSEINIADTLLSRAADLDVDLICMGAYGHSRLRELMLGGATRRIMQEMTVPILFAH